MRFKIELELENEKLPLDYRPAIISLFKHALTVNDNGKYFNDYYEVGKEKPFTFAVCLPNSKFTKEIVSVPNRKIDILFSTNDIATGIVFFNSMLLLKNKSYPLAYENAMTVKNIILEKEFAITTNTIDVIFRSPLCVRKHIKDRNKDIYYSYEKEGFIEELDKVLKLQVVNSNSFPDSVLDDFSIKPIECRKTVVRHHSQFVECTLGTFRLKGNIALLNYFYTNGMASRKSSGFGLLEIIGQEGL